MPDSIDVGLVFVDRDNKIVFFNRETGKMLNVDAKKRIGSSILLWHLKVFEQQVEQMIDEYRSDSQKRFKAPFLNYQGKYSQETFG